MSLWRVVIFGRPSRCFSLNRHVGVLRVATTTVEAPHKYYSTNEKGSAAGIHQSPVVGGLWRQRELIKQRQADSVSPLSLEPIAKMASESVIRIRYDFETDENLQDRYKSPWDKVRVGRILEDLDAIAGNVAFTHCFPASEKLHIVTAAVERIVLKEERQAIDKNMVLEGKLTWTGTSSMTIRMRAFNNSTASDHPWLEANFSYVARDLETGKAAKINWMLPETQEEEDLFKAESDKAQEKRLLRKSSAGTELKVGGCK